jgi:hypothetical protein
MTIVSAGSEAEAIAAANKPPESNQGPARSESRDLISLLRQGFDALTGRDVPEGKVSMDDPLKFYDEPTLTRFAPLPEVQKSSLRDISAAAYGVAYDTQQHYANKVDAFTAVVNAGRETFGNDVFQKPLTTLATAGAQQVAVVGAAYGAVAAAPAVGDFLFARGVGLLNSNNYLRVGWGWKGSATAGAEVFRIAIGNKNSWIHWHFP